MTIDAERSTYQLMVLPFPTAGIQIRLAYRELHTAVNGTAEEIKALGSLADLPRPWDPDTCREPELRHQLWRWLDDVVTWLNHEYAWDVTPLIPSCWPHHPHLIHDVAVLADQRRRAAFAFTSDPLEEWHRYALPSFTDRMRGRIKDHCSDGHKTWPARGRDMRHRSQGDRQDREDVYTADLDALNNLPPPPRHRRFGGVIFNIDTGEVLDDVDDVDDE